MTGILNSFILLGAIQGFIVSGLLLFSARRSPDGAHPKRLLAVLLLLLALACFNLYFYELPGILNTPIGNLLSALIPLVIVMPLGPLVYFYIRASLEPSFRVGRRQRPHFYSVIVDLFQHIASLFYIIVIIIGLIPPNKYPFGTWLDDYDQYADIPRWISLTIYLYISARYLAQVGKGRAGVPAPDPAALVWPRNLLRGLIAFDILWLIFLIPYELPKIGDALINRFDWYPLYLPLVVVIYWLGIKGYFITSRSRPAPASSPEPGSFPDKPAASRPALPPEITTPVVQAIRKAMDTDKCWLDPALSLTLLAQHCGIAPKTLSAVLNQHLEKPFNELVNEYRIEAVKTRLLQPESRELTIAALAYECGFNSLPTFQRAFKSVTGLTPKEFLQKHAQPADNL